MKTTYRLYQSSDGLPTVPRAKYGILVRLVDDIAVSLDCARSPAERGAADFTGPRLWGERVAGAWRIVIHAVGGEADDGDTIIVRIPDVGRPEIEEQPDADELTQGHVDDCEEDLGVCDGCGAEEKSFGEFWLTSDDQILCPDCYDSRTD